jgi:hypothetical protein
MLIGRFVVLAGIALFAAGCSTIDVQTDYDPGTDFSTLKTFKWVDAKGSDLDKNPLIKSRVRDAVIAAFKTKGYKESEGGEPDFFVFSHAGAKEKMNVTDWGYSYGAYWGPYGSYGRNIDVSYYTEASLFVDVVKNLPGKDELAWRGVGTGVMQQSATPEERAANINEAVQIILEDFPPGAKDKK